MEEQLPAQLCGNAFGAHELAITREIVQKARPRLRAEIARRVCEALDWRDAQGALKLMSGRVALLKLHRRGFIELPPPRNSNGNGKPLSRQEPVLAEPAAIALPAGQLDGLHLHRVDNNRSVATS